MFWCCVAIGSVCILLCIKLFEAMWFVFTACIALKYVSAVYIIIRATKAVKPLERILLDNGIVQEYKRLTATAATTSAVVGDMDISDEESVQPMVASSSSSNLKNAGKQLSTGTLNRNNSSANVKASGSMQSLGGAASAQEENYHTIAAKPSVFPARQCFCSVCGYRGSYSCTRCGSKFCSIKCNESHKETRCFKFSM